MATMKGNRILTSLYIEPEVHGALKRLSEQTRIPVAVYLREAVDDLLAKHGVSTSVEPSGEKPPRKVNYVRQEIQFWWNASDRSIHVTAPHETATKLHTTFKDDQTSERWHRSMFTWLARILESNDKPGPKVSR